MKIGKNIATFQSEIKVGAVESKAANSQTVEKGEILEDGGQLCTSRGEDTYRDLVLNTGHIEQRLDLLPQFPPGPGTQLQILAQVALDNLQGDTLFLHLLELLTGEVATAPGLHPGHDLGQTLITEFLHLTQDTGTEEDLFGARDVKGMHTRQRYDCREQKRRI